MYYEGIRSFGFRGGVKVLEVWEGCEKHCGGVRKGVRCAVKVLRV